MTGQSFVSVSATSVVSYDTSGTIDSVGRALFSFYLASGSHILINLSDYGVSLTPGDQLVFSCLTTGWTRFVYVSVSWRG